MYVYICYLLNIFNDGLRTGAINNLNQFQTKIQGIWNNKWISVCRKCLSPYLSQLVHPQNPDVCRIWNIG